MRIALSMRIVQATGYVEPRDAISHNWTETLVRWNMTPVLIPNALKNAGAYLMDMRPDVLVLTGGDDLGATPARDQVERSLLQAAMRQGVPVLGICRGLQLINDYFGGKFLPVKGHVSTLHSVTVMPPWQGVYGETMNVNSYHALGIEKAGLSPSLRVAATDADGGIEAAYHGEEIVAGVMWHPERPGAPAADMLLIKILAAEGAFWK